MRRSNEAILSGSAQASEAVGAASTARVCTGAALIRKERR